MPSPRILIPLALSLLLPHLLKAAPLAARWRAAGEPVGAGVGRLVQCAGPGCPVNPPETGPACWWFSYERNGTGSAGRLACLSPGDHYLDGLQGLKLTIAALASPPELIDPAPLADPDAPTPPARPPERDLVPIRYLSGLALFCALLFFWLRPRWPAWQLRRAAAQYARSPAPATLETLAACIRKIHPQPAPAQSPALTGHLRELDAARFGGGLLPAQTLAYFSGDAVARPAEPPR